MCGLRSTKTAHEIANRAPKTLTMSKTSSIGNPLAQTADFAHITHKPGTVVVQCGGGIRSTNKVLSGFFLSGNIRLCRFFAADAFNKNAPPLSIRESLKRATESQWIGGAHSAIHKQHITHSSLYKASHRVTVDLRRSQRHSQKNMAGHKQKNRLAPLQPVDNPQ